jgi:hypothetical protein
MLLTFKTSGQGFFGRKKVKKWPHFFSSLAKVGFKPLAGMPDVFFSKQKIPIWVIFGGP